MTLSFHIEYRTSWGEEIRVLGSVPELGDNRPEKALPLHTVDGIHWTSEAEISQSDAKEIHYSYHVYRDGQRHIHGRAQGKFRWHSLYPRDRHKR